MMANDLMRRNDWLNDPFFNDLGRHIFDSFTPTRGVDNSRLLKTDIQENDESYVVNDHHVNVVATLKTLNERQK